MEYGTWQERAEQERKDDRDWRATQRAISRTQGNLGLFRHVELTSFSCKRSEKGWKYTWRACVFGKHKVAFVDSVDLVEGMADSFDRLDSNRITWRLDMFHESNRK